MLFNTFILGIYLSMRAAPHVLHHRMYIIRFQLNKEIRSSDEVATGSGDATPSPSRRITKTQEGSLFYRRLSATKYSSTTAMPEFKAWLLNFRRHMDVAYFSAMDNYRNMEKMPALPDKIYIKLATRRSYNVSDLAVAKQILEKFSLVTIIEGTVLKQLAAFVVAVVYIFHILSYFCTRGMV